MSRPLPTPARILLHAPNPLGDAVLAEPAIRAIAGRFPEARVTVLVTLALGALPGAWPPGFPTITLPEPRRLFGRLDQWRVVRKIAAGHFDLGVVFPNSRLSARLLAEGGVRRIVGYARERRDALLTDPVAFVDRREHEHMVAYYWKLVEAVGGPPLPVAGRLAGAPADTPGILMGDDRTRPRLCPTPAMLREASALLARRGVRDRPYVVIAPGAGYGPAKVWPVEHFRELCRQLVDRRRLAVVLVGAGPDRDQCAALRGLGPSLDPFLVDLSGQTSAGALLGLIAGARAFLGNDSGPAHVAAALGTPGVVVFGSTSLVHSGPLSPSLRTVHRHLPCSPCFEKVCPLGHLDCLRGIPPGDVLQRLNERLERSR